MFRYKVYWFKKMAFDFFKIDRIFWYDLCNHCLIVLSDGWVFGRESNWYYSLEFLDEIYLLRKYKITSAFLGANQSIFKTSDEKMLVCDYNDCGELFVPRKVSVYPPEEMKAFWGFIFWNVGRFVSAVFFGTDLPPNIINKKISKETVWNVKKNIPKVVTTMLSYSSTEINDETNWKRRNIRSLRS